MGEAVVLIFVCFGYGFSRRLFGENTALLVAGACFILDQLLMSVGMARATYLKKIAVQPGDVSADPDDGREHRPPVFHLCRLVGGIIWMRWGYEYVFLLGVAIACVNLVSASRFACRADKPVVV